MPSKVTRIRKDRVGPAKIGQFKNLANAARSGAISKAEAQKKIRELVLAKKKGGKLEDAKKKITDPDYNVMSGRKGKQVSKQPKKIARKTRAYRKVT